MNKEYKTTIFLTSHDVGDIEKLCKRVIIINNGTIVMDDSMENLKYHYLNKKIVEAKMKERVNLALSREEKITTRDIIIFTQNFYLLKNIKPIISITSSCVMFALIASCLTNRSKSSLISSSPIVIRLMFCSLPWQDSNLRP